MSETDEIQLNLKWDNFSSHLALSFDSCYESQQFVDVSLVCKDGEVIKGHKMILANTSKFFRRLLTENEHPHPMIVLHNIDADDLRSLMTFMYCGEVQVFQNDLKKLLEIADNLEITGLQQIQEFDNPGNRFKDKTETPNKSGADYDMVSCRSGKPASNLLKYVSSLGQKTLGSTGQPFESSSKKLQQMARKFEKSSGIGSWSFLQQTQNSNETRMKEVANEGGPEPCRRLPEVESEAGLGSKSSSRKLQEMAKLLESINRNPTLSEVSKGTSEGHKRSFDSDEIGESRAKKPNMSRSNPNISEAEPEGDIVRLGATRDNPGQSIDEEHLIQHCSVFIKDELEVNTDCSTNPDIDTENLHVDNLNVNSNGEPSRPSMLAAEYLKAVAMANKRKGW